MTIKWYLLPNDTSWEKYWEKTSIEEQEKTTNNDYPKLLKAIKNYSNKDSVVLDGGCGLGRWLFFLRRLGYKNLIGVDFTTPPLEIIKKHDKEIKVIVGNADSLPIEDSSIDLYLSMGVIEHFEDGPEKALSEAYRVLSKEGKMIISVPYQNYYRSIIRRLITMPLLKLFKPSFRNKNRIFYQYYYSKKDLLGFITKSRFEIIEWFYYDRFHTKNIRLGMYLEFPFLRKKNGKSFEINQIGGIIAKFSELFSKGIFTSNIVFVVRKNSYQ